MNKKQVIIIWIMAILLSFISVLYGIAMFDDGKLDQGLLFVFVIPILLIGGLAFYCAKEKRSREVALETKQKIGKPVIPLQQRGRWGWGWLVLLALFVPGIQKVKFSDPMISVLAKFLVIPLLIIYFWVRSILIKKWVKEWELAASRWKASIVAGLVSLIITLILLGIPFYIDNTKMRADLDTTLKGFQGEMLTLEEKEQRLLQAFISEPKSGSDIRNNLGVINEYFKLMDRKFATSNRFITELQEIYKKAKKSEKLEAINNLHQLVDRQYDLGKKSLEALKQHYKTKDEHSFREYERMLGELEILQKIIQDSIPLCF